MAVAIPFEETERIERKTPVGSPVRLFNYLLPGDGHGPQAHLAEYPTPDVLPPHFHRVDQFQVVVQGGGSMGKRSYDPVTVQYTDGFTTYGPIEPTEEGISFFVLRAQGDEGVFLMPESRHQMEQKPGRRMITAAPRNGDATSPANDHVVLFPVSDDGMTAATVWARQGDHIHWRDPSEGGGQYMVVIEGVVDSDGRELGELSLAWVEPTNQPLDVVVRSATANLVFVQFPRPRS